MLLGECESPLEQRVLEGPSTCPGGNQSESLGAAPLWPGLLSSSHFIPSGWGDLVARGPGTIWSSLASEVALPCLSCLQAPSALWP